MYYDFKRAEENGIEGLHMGGAIINGNFYREKDILEDDYSEPIYLERVKVEKIEKAGEVSGGVLYLVHFKNGKLFLTKDELDAGLIK